MGKISDRLFENIFPEQAMKLKLYDDLEKRYNDVYRDNEELLIKLNNTLTRYNDCLKENIFLKKKYESSDENEIDFTNEFNNFKDCMKSYVYRGPIPPVYYGRCYELNSIFCRSGIAYRHKDGYRWENGDFLSDRELRIYGLNN